MEVIEVLSELILTFFVDAAYSWFRMSVALVARALPSIEIFCVRMVRGVGFAHQFTSIYKENPPINVTARAAEQPSPLEASSSENVARSARSFTSGRQ